MKEAIKEATKYFCKDILDFEISEGKSIGNDFYGASIPIYEDGKETDWYLFFKKESLNEVAKVLLFEDNLSEDDLDDLLKEIANLIIGKAKVILEEKNKQNNYKIGTPEFLGKVGEKFPIKLKNKLLFNIKNRTFLIAQKAES
jgi:chemotaxis protein CheY-P-specific phosphatase CheC